MKRLSIILTSLLMLSLLGAYLSPVSAQDTQPTSPAPKSTPSDNDVNAVAKQMYCPVCENIPLDVCPTTACQEWRELIRQKLAEGWSDEQIKDYFAAQYGDRVLAEPPRRGLNWLVYVLPPIFIVGGAIILWSVLRSMRRTKAGLAAPTAGQESSQVAANDDPYLAKLEEELRKQQE